MHVVSAAHHQTNLPQPPTSFVGRAVELAKIRRLLGTTHLVTLSGPGRSSKTRMALQAATHLLPMFVDGVWWCDLVAIIDPTHVPQTVAAALGLSEPADRPALDAMADALQVRQTLIILDNCEHVLATCAAQAHRLLGACPEVTLLATSLQPLGLVQERVWPTPPVALPAARSDPDSLDVMQQYDAVRLFVERARAALAEFTLDGSNAAIVATICRRLDGLSLVLEMAAARLRLLTVEQIAERLDDAFHLLMRETSAHIPRHQALRQYSALRQLLRDELGADPSVETLLPYERLRREDDV
jgi:predicted ATPase